MTSEQGPAAAGGETPDGDPRRRETLLLAAAYAALLLLGLYLRLPGLDPAGFRSDDSWLAIAIRKMSWQDFLTLRPPVPIGFWGLQRLVSSIADDPEWPLQLVPLAASLLLPVLTGALVARLCNDRWAGLVAAAWTLVAPVWTQLAVRPKQYPSDALATVALLLLAVRAWQQPGPTRSRAFLVGCVVALLCSFPSVFVIAPALAVTAWLIWTHRQPVAPVLVTLALLAAALFFIQTQSGEAPRVHWAHAGAYMPTDSPAAAWGFVRAFLADVAVAGFPPSTPLLALGAAVGVLGLLRDATGRKLLLVIAGIHGGLLTANALGLYPVYTGRLASFHRPLTPILLGVGVHLCLRRLPGRPRSLALVLVAAAALPFAERSSYKPSRDADVARALSERLGPDDTLIHFVRSAHGLGYYTSLPVEMVADERLGSGFLARPVGPRVHTLWLGKAYALASYPELDATLAELPLEKSGRIVFVPPRFGDEQVMRRSRHIVTRLRERGYRRSPAFEKSPWLLVLEPAE